MSKTNTILSIFIVFLLLAVTFHSISLIQDEDGIEDGDIILNPDLKIIGDDEDPVPMVVGDDRIELEAGTDPGMMDYDIGDIIMINKSGGYLRQVTGFSMDGDRPVIHTVNASLADVILKGGFEYNGMLEPLTNQQPTDSNDVRPLSGIAPLRDISYYEEAELREENRFDFGEESSFQSIYTFQSSIYFQMDYYRGLKSFDMILTGSLNITHLLEIEPGLKIGQKIDLKPIELKPITIYIVVLTLPIPITLHPSLDIELIYSFEMETETAFVIESNMILDFRLGLLYRNGEWSYVNDISPTFNLQRSDIVDSIKAEISLNMPKFAIKIYNRVGPYLELTPYIAFRVQEQRPLVYDWSIHYGLRLKIGINDLTLLKGSFLETTIEGPSHIFPVRNTVFERGRLDFSSGPGPPGELRAEPGDSSVTLNWDPPEEKGGSSITHYKIYRTALGRTSVLNLPASQTSYTDSGLNNGERYVYKVTTVNLRGESAASNEISVVPGAAITSPGPPTDLIAIPGDCSVTLTWNPPMNDGGTTITNYKVYRTAEGVTTVITVPGSQTYLTDSPLINGEEYSYRVAAVNVLAEGPRTGTVKSTPSFATWSATTVVSTESTSDSRTPSIAVGPDGMVHVVWADITNYDGAGWGFDIFYKSYDGTSWSTTTVVSTESTMNSYSPSIAVGPDGMVHVVWRDQTDYDGAGTDTDIFHKSYDGTSWSTTTVVSTESTMNSYSPSIAVGPDGMVHVVWADITNYDGAGWDFDIFYKHLH